MFLDPTMCFNIARASSRNNPEPSEKFADNQGCAVCSTARRWDQWICRDPPTGDNTWISCTTLVPDDFSAAETHTRCSNVFATPCGGLITSNRYRP
jgi:hypothetical protein